MRTGGRGNGFKLKERFRLDIKRKLFTARLLSHQNKLPRDAACAPSLEVFKARMDEVPSSLAYW